MGSRLSNLGPQWFSWASGGRGATCGSVNVTLKLGSQTVHIGDLTADQYNN
jgi:hypothetical protein